MRSLTTFREPLRKRQIADLANEDVEKSIEAGLTAPVENQIFFKRLKVYVDAFISSNESNAIDDFNKDKIKQYNGVNVSFTQGAAILDYSKDPIYEDLARQLKERKDLLDTAAKQTDPVFDGDAAQVPKLDIKDYRKDSLNIRL